MTDYIDFIDENGNEWTKTNRFRDAKETIAALKESYIEFFYVNQQLNGVLDEDGEPLYTEGKSVTDALAKTKQTLTSTLEVALSEVRKAERERCAVLLENGRFLHDQAPTKLFATEAANAIRAMGDE